jgi:GntR family transcriptional repressor for pyruvate dehydrogenase complex
LIVGGRGGRCALPVLSTDLDFGLICGKRVEFRCSCQYWPVAQTALSPNGLIGQNSPDPIVAKLAELIQEVGSNRRLPSERDMAESLGVSRVALRDRLQGFEVLGIVERRQGAGTFVRELDPAGLASLLDLMLASAHVSHDDLHTVRIALERESARQAALSDGIDLGEMYRCLYIFEHGKRVNEIVEADASFHRHLMKVSGSPGLSFFADALQLSLFKSLHYRNRRWSRLVGINPLLVDLHLEIVRAIEDQDPERAASAVDRHFTTFDQLVVQGAPAKRTKSRK